MFLALCFTMSQCRFHSRCWSLAQSSMAIMKQYLCYSLEASASPADILKAEKRGESCPWRLRAISEVDLLSSNARRTSPQRKHCFSGHLADGKKSLQCILPQVSFPNTTTLMLFFKSLRAIKDKETTVP